MDTDALTQARLRLREAKSLIRQRRIKEAKLLLEQLSELDTKPDPKEIVETAAELLNRIERERRLKISRWVLIGTVLITSVVVGILTIRPIRSTAIELKLHVGRVDFRTEKPINLEPIGLSGIDVVGKSELKIKLANENTPTSSKRPGVMLGGPKSPDTVGSSIMRGMDPFTRVVLQSSYLRLSDLFVPEKAMVVFDTPESTVGILKVIVSGQQCIGSLDIATNLTLSCQDCEIKKGREPWRPGDQSPIKLESESKVIYFTGNTDTGTVKFNLMPTVNKNTSLLLGRNLRIDSLALIRPQRDKPPVSSIVAPSQVIFTEFSKREFAVAPGDFLKLGKIYDFHIKSVSFDRYLTIDAAGKIREIEKISGNLRRNLMPSYLEWLLANYALNLFMAGLLPVLSVVLAVIYRLKILDEG